MKHIKNGLAETRQSIIQLYGRYKTLTAAARIAFFDTRAELLAEGLPRLITECDQQHGLESSGHPPGNNE